MESDLQDILNDNLKVSIQASPLKSKATTPKLMEKLVANFDVKREAFLRSKRSHYSKTGFTPYDIGFPCNAYHWFSFEYGQVEEPDYTLLEIFEEGHLHEPSTLKKLASGGIQIEQINYTFEIKIEGCKSIRGKIDSIGKAGGAVFPVEAKSLAPHTWDGVNESWDFLKMKGVHFWLYPYQMLIYQHVVREMTGKKSDRGIFALKNKVTGKVKLLLQEYDSNRYNELIERVRLMSSVLGRPKEEVEANILPTLRDIDDRVCGQCEYRGQCLGKLDRMVPLMESAELEELLLRREMLKGPKSEYEEIDRRVKKQVDGIKEVLVGDFYITGGEINRKGYTVEPSVYWQSKIVYKGATNGGSAGGAVQGDKKDRKHKQAPVPDLQSSPENSQGPVGEGNPGGSERSAATGT